MTCPLFLSSGYFSTWLRGKKKEK